MGYPLSVYKIRKLRIVSADMANLVSNASRQGVIIYNVSPVDDLTWEMDISSADYHKMKDIAEKYGGKIKLLRTAGVGTLIDKCKQRPIFIGLMLMLFGLSLFLPNWIFFLHVEGNDTVPTRLILEEAEKAGVRFGAYRRGIRSEKVKNIMLSNIGQLSWVGVNTNGCVATISVRERQETKEIEVTKSVGSIIASRDGVVSELTVLRGAALCEVGSAVKQGDVLISGYTDSGLIIRGETASGEVFAKTNHQFSVISDVQAVVRQVKTKEKRTYWFFVGKKLIKLWKGSGISGVTCVKMYEIEHLALPGGFQLPIGILVQKEFSYSCDQQEVESTAWLEEGCQNYLLTQMNAGRILSGSMIPIFRDGVLFAQCNYACHEMIGQLRYEETLINYGKSD